MEYLSNIELYYCASVLDDAQTFLLVDDEYQHCVKVMRNSVGDKLFSTDGCGNIFEGIITEFQKGSVAAKIEKKYCYKNVLQNFTFYIPNLKNPDRLKFALEKSTELGITNFVLFNSENTVSKGFKLDRLNKFVLAAMKQSLRSFLPNISAINSIAEIKNYSGEKVLFDQLSTESIKDYRFDPKKNYLMIFGPEGGLSQKEIEIINPTLKFSLIENRLRSETAIVKAASIIS
ncbi:MAG: 16S rRNA (uracil(1498)-N(3))-methyltransferase [Ignavibacteriales bacterium]|nr:16S rRNA (uracil(1498)-N(3))-methyltransferase [Ignavibacteriales bacterium]